MAAPVCRSCHPGIARSFANTGMGRSFYRLTPDKAIEDFQKGNTYYHAASDRYYTMIERSGRYFQRRHQLDSTGGEINVVEKEIHYVMGSGNHARTYLHRTPQGTLLQLPLGWYSEAGGNWAMSPGYDHPKHEGFRRTIAYQCMACHNAYPARVESKEDRPIYLADLPEGIDCRRCHGPGEEHVRRAGAGEKLDAVRSAIINPARLDKQRALDVCMQCHLQSMVGELPYAVRLPGRGPFSYRPSEPMGSHAIHFEPADGSARRKFEIDSAGYRMLQSTCYRSSAGGMICTTCHDPHRALRGQEAIQHYTRACLGCHARPLSAGHPPAPECVSCHMPKRRTEDVVHVVMTDHAIPRRPPAGDPLALIPETHPPRYRGEVVPYYPAVVPPTAETRLVVALAQVVEDSNTEAGVERLRSAIEAVPDPPGKALVELARGFHRLAKHTEAGRWFRAAIERDPRDAAARAAFAKALLESGQDRDGLEQLRRARELEPDNPRILADLGAALVLARDFGEAARVLREAIRLDPDLPVAHNSIGLALSGQGSADEAVSAYREAIRVQPDYAEAYVNLGTSLATSNRRAEARQAFEAALRHDPQSAAAHYNHGLLLVELGEANAAAMDFRKAIEIDPSATQSRVQLAFYLLAQQQYAEAQFHLDEALKLNPQLAKARLYLGVALLAQGKREQAREQLRIAADSDDPEVRRSAAQQLRRTQR